jgi:hypothetical protein
VEIRRNTLALLQKNPCAITVGGIVMKLTKRGKRVRAVALVLWAVLVIYLAGHINYTGQGVTGYCWGTIAECYEGGL